MITQVHLAPWRRPLIPPVRDKRQQTGWWLRLTDETGAVGYGDATCWTGFGAGHEAVEAALPRLADLRGLTLPQPCSTFADATGQIARTVTGLALPTELAYAAELALLDITGRRLNASVADLLAGRAAPRHTVALHAQVADAAGARAAVAVGLSTLKVKVGGAPLAEDCARVAAIRAAVPAEVKLRLDANGAWSLTEAEAALRSLAAFAPLLVEQPVASLAELATLRRRQTTVRLAADEAVTCAADLGALLAQGAADAVVLKPMYLGGLTATRDLATAAAGRGLEVILTHALESPVGRLGALHLACALPFEPAPGGLALGGPHVPTLTRPEGPGLGELSTLPEVGALARAQFREVDA